MSKPKITVVSLDELIEFEHALDADSDEPQRFVTYALEEVPDERGRPRDLVDLFGGR